MRDPSQDTGTPLLALGFGASRRGFIQLRDVFRARGRRQRSSLEPRPSVPAGKRKADAAACLATLDKENEVNAHAAANCYDRTAPPRKMQKARLGNPNIMLRGTRGVESHGCPIMALPCPLGGEDLVSAGS